MNTFIIKTGEKEQFTATIRKEELVRFPNLLEPIFINHIYWEAKSLSYKRLLEILENMGYSLDYSPDSIVEKEDMVEFRQVVKFDPVKFTFENLSMQIKSLINNERLKGNLEYELKLVQLDLGMSLKKNDAKDSETTDIL